MLILDVIRPAQFAAAGWTVPIEGQSTWRRTCRPMPRPTPSTARSWRCPAFADAHVPLLPQGPAREVRRSRRPQTWDELTAAAKTIQAGENDPNLQGLSFQGKAIEGAVCTFLLPLLEPGQEPRRERQADVRPRRRGEVAGAVEGLRRPGRHQEEHRRGRHRRHAQGVPGRRRRLRGQLVLRLGAVPGSGIGGRRARSASPAAGDRRAASRRPASAAGSGAYRPTPSTRRRRPSWSQFLSSPEVAEFMAINASLLPPFPDAVHRPRRHRGGAVVRRRPAGGRDGAPAAGDAALQRGERGHPHHGQRGARRA